MKNNDQKKSSQDNLFLLLGVILLTILPLIFIKGEYKGADGEAQEAIAQIDPTYEPWFKHIFQPPSREIESLLFATQSAIGAGVVGYVIGLYQGRSQSKRNKIK